MTTRALPSGTRTGVGVEVDLGGDLRVDHLAEASGRGRRLRPAGTDQESPVGPDESTGSGRRAVALPR